MRWYLCDGAGAFVLRKQESVDPGFYIENVYIESAGGNKPSAMNNSYPFRYLNPLQTYEGGFHHIKTVVPEGIDVTCV